MSCFGQGCFAGGGGRKMLVELAFKTSRQLIGLVAADHCRTKSLDVS